MAEFYDHEVVQRAPEDYVESHHTPQDILKAWATSIFAHEILTDGGEIKPQKAMQEATLEKFIAATDAFKKGESQPKPIIGVGIMDNIEIGIGREIIAAAKDFGIDTLPVHMRKAQAAEIEKMLK